jgi:hypothetical protein
MQTQPITTQHLTPELANLFFQGLPTSIQAGLDARAKAMNYPIWAVIEMAIAGYLDDESLSFTDCKPRIK